MKHEIITHVQGQPDWKTVPVIAIDELYRPTEAKIKAFAQIAYDETALYIHMWAEETKIRAEVTDPLDQPCRDSCLEFFFSPAPPSLRYFNMEYNLNCKPYLGIGNSIYDLVRLFPQTTDFNAKANLTETGWEVEYAVPYSFIRVFFPDFAPKTGDKMRANFYKCGDRTEIKHYLAWSCPDEQAHGFHCPECFGELEFA